jgi:ATP-dependent Clp protease ATP-binding subunit ClpA
LIDQALRQYFRPEFLNRLDDIVIFHSLTSKEILEIVDLQLAQVAARLKERRLTLRATPEAKTQLSEVGFDPQFGARPLKRTIQRLVVDPLTAKILAGEVRDGQEVTIAAEKGTIRLSFGKAPKATAA